VARRIALVVGIVLTASLAGDLSGRAEPVRTPALRPARPIVVAPDPLPKPSHTRRLAQRGTLVAQVRAGRVVAVRSAPGGPVVARLSSRTEFGSPRTFAVTRGGRGLHVITTELPNGRIGWVDAPRALRLSRARVTLEVDLSARLLRVRDAGRLVRTMRVGTGAPGTPTPTGRFAITDELRGSDYSAVYGCCILALSGHQTNLPPGWTGGDRLAIHGGSTAGAVSTGCLRADERDLRYLMRLVPLGAQIVIHP
jgi:lipoprotein-anchoring transpeptidase ErfK/SrfK